MSQSIHINLYNASPSQARKVLAKLERSGLKAAIREAGGGDVSMVLLDRVSTGSGVLERIRAKQMRGGESKATWSSYEKKLRASS